VLSSIHTVICYSNGLLDTSLACLEDLYHECGRVESLLAVAEPTKWRTAFENLCNKLEGITSKLSSTLSKEIDILTFHSHRVHVKLYCFIYRQCRLTSM